MNNRIAVALIGAAVGLSALSPPAAAQSDEITVSVWGGGYGEVWKKNSLEAFTKATGIKVNADLGPSSQRLSKLLATQGSGIDLFFITDHQMAVLKLRGLLQPVDPKNVPNMANLYDFARDPLGEGLCPAITLLGVGLAYNKQHYPQPPASWKEMTRRDLPGKPAMMDIGFSVAPSVMIHLAELNGGSINDISPAFKLLAGLKDHMRYFKLFEVLDWINRGEVSIAPMLNSFVKRDPKTPLEFTFPKDGLLGVVNMACIPKGAKNKAGAEKFLNYYLSAEVQAKMAASFGETPVVKNVPLPKDIPYELVPIERIATMKFYDPVAIARQRDKWMERFQEEIVAR